MNAPVHHTGVMIIDDDLSFLESAEKRLRAQRPEWIVRVHSDPFAALHDDLYMTGSVDVVVCDLHFEAYPDSDGLDILLKMMRQQPSLFTILVTNKNLNLGAVALQWHVKNFIFKGDHFLEELAAAIEEGVRLRQVLITPPLCFAIMPFGIEHLEEIYNRIWRPAARKAGFRLRRIDENHAGELLLKEISNEMDAAEVVLADLSELRPNVLIEVGLAYAKGKVVLLVSPSGNKIPSNIAGVHQIRYDRSRALWEDKLEEELVRALSHAAQKLVHPLLSPH
jgi:hypothetical protein